jgi:hypothetical protein
MSRPLAPSPAGDGWAFSSCPDCGAVHYGNLTCRRCRQHMREETGPSEWLDKLDALNIATVPPVGPEELQAFQKRLEQRAAANVWRDALRDAERKLTEESCSQPQPGSPAPKGAASSTAPSTASTHTTAPARQSRNGRSIPTSPEASRRLAGMRNRLGPDGPKFYCCHCDRTGKSLLHIATCKGKRP